VLALVEAVVEVQAEQQVARLELTGKAERQAEQQQVQQGAERLEPKRQKVAEVREQEREPQAVQQVVAYQPQGAQAVLLGLCRLLH
jgi:hypothetical protein